MKCVNCKKTIESDRAFMTVPDTFTHLGPRGLYRKPSIFWCEKCWSENIRINDKSRAEADARDAALLAKLDNRQHACPTCGGQCRCDAPRAYCVHCA